MIGKGHIMILTVIIFALFMISVKGSQEHSTIDNLISQVFVQNKCKIPDKPEKVGIWTMTRFRIGPEKDTQTAIAFFKQFINYYAEMQCQVFDSIYFIWNNENPPESYGVTERRKHWKKNVFFIHTFKNSLDSRNIVPPWVKQQVFINLDDDAIVDCYNLRKMLDQWKQKSIGNIGPIGSKYGRTIVYNQTQDIFQYTFPKEPTNIFNVALTGASILSRHFMHLYYADIFEFNAIRQRIRTYFNCEDIAINFMVNLMYNEFQSFKFQNVSCTLKPSNYEISRQSSSSRNRKSCAQQFSMIFGKHPNPYVFTSDPYQYKSERSKPQQINVCLTLLKKSIIQQKYFNYQHYYLNIQSIYSYTDGNQLEETIEQQNKILSLSLQEKIKLIKDNKLDVSYKAGQNLAYVFQDLVRNKQLSQVFANQEKSQGTIQQTISSWKQQWQDKQIKKDSQQGEYRQFQNEPATPNLYVSELFILYAIIVFQLIIIVYFWYRLHRKTNEKQILQQSDQVLNTEEFQTSRNFIKPSVQLQKSSKYFI